MHSLCLTLVPGPLSAQATEFQTGSNKEPCEGGTHKQPDTPQVVEDRRSHVSGTLSASMGSGPVSAWPSSSPLLSTDVYRLCHVLRVFNDVTLSGTVAPVTGNAAPLAATIVVGRWKTCNLPVAARVFAAVCMVVW